MEPRDPESAGAPDGAWKSPFSVGRVLSSSLSIFGRHLPVLLVLSVAFHALPLWLHGLQAEAYARAHEEWLSRPEPADPLHLLGGPLLPAWLLAQWALPLAFQAVVTLAVFHVLHGRPARWRASVIHGWKRIPAALASSLVVGLVIATPVVALGMVNWGIAGLCISVGLFCLWFVAVQAAVVERMNPLRAIARSARLTQGVLRRIFVLLCLLYGGPQLLLWFLRVAVFDGNRVVNTYIDATWVDTGQLWLEGAFDAFFGALQAVTAVVVYHALRRAKEGVGLDELLAVFD